MGKCAICFKKILRGTGPFFRVPGDEAKLLLWESSCRMKFSSTDFICADHFSSSHIINAGKMKRLLPVALPSVPSTSSKDTLAVEQTMSSDSWYDLSGSKSVDSYTEGFITELVQVDDSSKSKDSETQTSRVPSEDSETQTYSVIFEALKEPVESAAVSLLKKEVAILKRERDNLCRKLKEKDLLLDNFRQIFTEGQMRKILSPDRKICWDWMDISNAICLHAAGPRAYHHLYDKGFPLPHVSTLQRWSRKTDISEGLLAASFDSFEHMSDLKDDDKLCVLSFDEMKVAEAYEYDQLGDYVRKPAKFVQVVMARGLIKSWKQPVFYAFDAPMTRDALCSIIVSLQNINFPVVAIVSDMGSTNQTLWKQLKVTPDDPWFPHPSDETSKVFVFADVPHLLKLVRNHFIDQGIIYNGHRLSSRTICDLLNHTSSSDVSIAHKISFENLSVKGAGGKTCFDHEYLRLQLIHIVGDYANPRNNCHSNFTRETYNCLTSATSQQSFARQKVKPAAQLFSNTVANAIRRCYTVGFEIYEAVETANFIQLVNDWFDILNSSIRTFSYPGKEPFGKNLARQMDVLNRMNELMSKPIIPEELPKEKNKITPARKQKKMEKEIKPFQKGILTTNRALVGLYNYLKTKSNVEYLLTYRLNQDVLENFFGAIRSKGGLNDHPTAKEFQYRLRKYILARNTESLKDTGNVSKDSIEWLVPQNSSTPLKALDPNRSINSKGGINKSVNECTSGAENKENAGHGELSIDEQSEVLKVVEAISSSNTDECPSGSANTENGGDVCMNDQSEVLEVVEALSSSHQDDCGILQEDALSYISGYMIKKLNLEELVDFGPSFGFVDQVSKGFLKKPSPHMLHGVKKMEKIFHHINALEISHSKNLHHRLVSCSEHVQLPESVKKLFFKCRIYFRIRSLNKRLKIQKAKQRLMGFKKFIKIKI